MLGRLSYRTITLVLFALLISAAHGANTGSISAKQYLAQKKSLGAKALSSSNFRCELEASSGKVIELTGKVGGIMKCGDSSSFLLDCSGESLVIKCGTSLPECISTGNTIRILSKADDQSAVTMSDLQFICAAYDYDVTTLERQITSKAEKEKNSSPVPYRGSDPKKFLSAQQGRGVNLSSRAMTVYDPYRKAIAKFNPRLTAKQLDTITASILAYSEHYGIDPRLVIALILAESGFKPTATSRCGAMGLCQLMPGTARGLGVSNAYDPEQNIEASVRLMRGHLKKYGDLALALSAYNAGPVAVAKHGGVPPYRETRNYIVKVSQYYKALCGK